MTRIPKNISLFPILLVTFIETMGFIIVLPFFVFLGSVFGGNALVFGIVAAMYPAFQLVGAPILGRWSDHYGRKKVLLISQGGTLAAWIIFLSALFLPIENIFAVDIDQKSINITQTLLCLTALDYIPIHNISEIAFPDLSNNLILANLFDYSLNETFKDRKSVV